MTEIETVIIEQDFKKETIKEKSIRGMLFLCASVSIFFVFFIILFLFLEGGEFFTEVNFWDFLFGVKWLPAYEKSPSFGAATIIVGTFLVAFGAMVIAVPLGIATAIYISELAPPRISKIMKAAVEILSGVPSVIFGFFGLVVLNVWLMDTLGLTTGNTWFSGSLILALMALPTIVSVSEDALNAVPNDYREASLAMGATKWQTIRNAVLPAALSGITAAIILGIGRAVGETMAVMMVTGNTAIFPEPITNMFTPIRTITGTIGIELREATGVHQQALFALAIVLFFITLGINLSANLILSRINKRFTGELKERKFKLPIPKVVKNQKKNIRLIVLVAIVFWVLYTWIGLMSVLIVGLALGIKYIVRKISAENHQRFIFAIIVSAMLFVVAALFIILYYIITEGFPAISVEFLTTFPRDLGREGGILPAIYGTILLIGGSILFAVPIGVCAGIYLSEYAKNGKVTKVIRAGIDNLNGTPSIVFGLFAYVFFVLYLDFGRSMLAGQLALALMILPTIIKTTEEAVKAVPFSFREGSLALGSTKWQSIRRIVLPAAIPGVITGIILSMGRVAGETAPILYTATVFTSRWLPSSPFDPVSALTSHLYTLVAEIPNSHLQAAGTALVLLVMVIFLYAIAIIIRNYYLKKMRY